MTVTSARSSASSTSTRLSALAPGLALVLNVAGSPTLAPGLALVLDVGCPPGRLLLRSVATLAVAVAVLAPLALSLAVAVLAGERARRRPRSA